MVMWRNGTWLEDDGAFVFGAADRIRLGDGIFDTLLAVDGWAVHAGLHWERLAANAQILGIPFSLPVEKFLSLTAEIIQKSKAQSGRYAVNTVLSRGMAQRGLMPPENAAPVLVMRLAPVPSEFPPIHALIARNVRRNEGSPLSRIKSCNYGDNILALIESRGKGGNEAIMLNNAGHVTCASSSNLFIEKEGALFTPPLSDGVLHGIARQVFMSRYPVSEKSLLPDDLAGAEAIYLTNSIRGAQAIEMLDGKALSGGRLQIDKDFYLG